MSPLEMHIEFNRGTQQIAANKTFKWLPQEVDLMLNKAMNRFIQSKLKASVDQRGVKTGGFEVAQLDADAIRTIIVSSYDLQPYIDTNNRRYKCFLPPDYMFLLSDWSYTTLLCEGIVATTATDNLYIVGLRQEKSVKSAPQYYTSLQVQIGPSVVSWPGDLPFMNSYTGLDDIPDIQFFMPFIAKSGNWYQDRFNGLNWPGYYISVATNAPQQGITLITVDGVSNQNIKQSTQPLVRHTATSSKYFDNRLSATDNISGLNSTEFIKSSHYSAISELTDGILYIYYDNSFIVSAAGISYIRRPQPISLYLNTKCELPDAFHLNICDLAIEMAKADLENSQGYQMKVADNERRVVL